MPQGVGVCGHGAPRHLGPPHSSQQPPHHINVVVRGSVFFISAFLEEQFLSQPETTIDVTSVVQYVSASVRFVVVAQSYTLSEISFLIGWELA